MATDYDAPRHRIEDELETDSLEGLRAAESTRSDMDDDGEDAETYDIRSTDLTREELDVAVVPKASDEFTCGSCFIVQKRSRLSHVEPDGTEICLDCS
ncbi:MAG: DUF4193 family protein [Corynebacterium sp.]|nr:DUF4193 family protein [Corynebacterium sp.]